MALSPRRSPSRPTATGAARLRDPPAARSLFPHHRNFSRGVERRPDGRVDGAAMASRRRGLSLGSESRRAPTHLPREELPRASDFWANLRGVPSGFERSMALLKGTYGCGGGDAPQNPTRVLSSAVGSDNNDNDHEAEETVGWESTPVDLLCRIFSTLHTAETYWVVSHVCGSWRYASFLLQRPMVLSISTAGAIDGGMSTLKLLIAKPSRARDGTMETGRIFGFHRPSAYLSVKCGTRLIGTAAGIPLFLGTNGNIELPSIFKSSLFEFITGRYRLPPGVNFDVQMVTVDDDRMAIITYSHLLMCRGTAPNKWFSTSLNAFQIEKVISLVLVNGMAYLLDEDRRFFQAELLSSSLAMKTLNMTRDLPQKVTWEKLWLTKCPIGASVRCIYYREFRNKFQFSAYDLVQEDVTWAWVRKSTLGNTAVFVNWGSGSLGFAHRILKDGACAVTTCISPTGACHACLIDHTTTG